MRLKKLHIVGSFLAAGIAITTLSSNSGGIMGQSTLGCSGGSCHGSQDATMPITLTGLPATGWVPGTTYSLTLTATTAAAQAGFDLTANIGTLTALTANTMVMGNEYHHTRPQVLSGGAAIWNFTWKAPTSRTTPLTMNIAVNAVNGNGSADANDHWNKTTVTSNASTTSIATTFSESGFSIYPNPVSNVLTVNAKTGASVTLTAASINGSFTTLATQKVAADQYQVDVNKLAAGSYLLLLTTEGKTYTTRFVKQ